MSKQNRKPKTVENVDTHAVESVEVETVVTETAEVGQAVEKTEDFARKSVKETASAMDKAEGEGESMTDKAPKQEKARSGGTGIALLALLVALGVGGAGYFLGNQKFVELDGQIKTLGQKVAQMPQTVMQSPEIEIPSFEAEKTQIAQLAHTYQQANSRVEQLEKEQNAYIQQINALQQQVQRLGANPVAEPTAWLFSDADFLLNNALRKMALDNDIDTARSLLIEADNVLSQVSDPKALAIRNAIKTDLNTLDSVNEIDQNTLMQRLARLANLVDNLPMADSGESEKADNGEVSDSIDDWQKNIEKSADSFLSHFIRINDKGRVVNDKAFIAPNQEIYLRENIRLRLQIAILAVPRQQNELYKQSLEAVSTWVRSYFDLQNADVQTFLKELDSVGEQSIYVDAPHKLQSLELLERNLNKASKPIVKVQLDETKALEQLKAEDAQMPVEPRVDAAEPTLAPATEQ
ncbi:HemX protein [Bibersteinia trehalosi]|uniref:HemX protein n=1 Tax=Bibersteinia trehalosi TaxID=47735 RepID=A0A426FFW6_BIBTR|nr:uroporphyrinogen-III C-methyltransferase [Bibersteinia trehalosi]RRN00979.1 HemX protein [Bibersteinia trehalosi]